MNAFRFGVVGAFLLLTFLAGCQQNKPEFAKVSLSDLQQPQVDSLVGRKVEVKGYAFNGRPTKLLLFLYEDDSKKAYVSLSFYGYPAGIEEGFKSVGDNIGRQLLVRGKIVKFGPFPLPKAGEGLIQLPTGPTYHLDVESVEVVK